MLRFNIGAANNAGYHFAFDGSTAVVLFDTVQRSNNLNSGIKQNNYANKSLQLTYFNTL